MKCPKCGSTHIDQYRMVTGAIWCVDCKYRVEQKEVYNPFAIEIMTKEVDLLTEYLGKRGEWRDVADSANTTVNKEHGTKEPSSEWKRKMLFCEHSPIRQMNFKFIWKNLKYWISVHLVRHKFGIEHFVRSQRTDRTGVNRDVLPQSALVEHEICVNAQALINISRKRLCRKASKETREAWEGLLKTLYDKDREVWSACVPECVYRNGLCPEFKSCGWNKTDDFKTRLMEYTGMLSGQICDYTNIFLNKSLWDG